MHEFSVGPANIMAKALQSLGSASYLSQPSLESFSLAKSHKALQDRMRGAWECLRLLFPACYQHQLSDSLSMRDPASEKSQVKRD